jgi:hypothetical protein
MRTFRFDVSLVVEAQAFDHLDAEEMIRDAFGLGEVCGLDIVESEVGDFSETR